MRGQIANMITFSRMGAAVLLGLSSPSSFAFSVLYSYCGITDIADGMVARKLQSESKVGAVLDSIADMFFFIAALYRLLPILLIFIPKQGMLWIAAIVVVRVMAYIVGAIKFHRFAALHTVSNKVVGIALFCVPYLLPFMEVQELTFMLCVLAGISAVEELLCEIKSEHYHPNIKSVFEVLGWERRKCSM